MKTYLILTFLAVIIITGCGDPGSLDPNKNIIPDKTQYIYFTMTNKFNPAYNDIYRLNLLDTTDCRLIKPLASLWCAPGGNIIVYSKRDTINNLNNLNYCDLNGNNETSVLSRTNNIIPMISPNGKDVMFYEIIEGFQTQFSLNSVKLPNRKLITYDLTHPSGAFSKDGKYFASYANHDLYLLYKMNLINNAVDSIGDNIHSNVEPNMVGYNLLGNHENIDWSLDERFIACSCMGGSPFSYRLITFDINKNLVKILDEQKSGNDLLYPIYSPDGSKIAYISHKSPDMIICTIDTNGTNKKELIATGISYGQPSNGRNMLWHPDGKHILFTSKGTFKKVIKSINIETGAVKVIFTPPGNLNMNEYRIYFAE